LREETFTLAHPVVDRIMRSVSDELPIAFVIARYNKFCGATVTKNKSRRVRVDTSTATIAHSQPNASILRDVDPVKSVLFRCKRCARRVDFEVLMLAIKFNQSDSRCALDNTEGNAFVAKRHDLQSRVWGKAYEVARIKLYFESRFAISREGVALDQWKIEPCALPISVVPSFEAYVTGDQTDAHDSRFHVVLICFIVGGAYCYGDSNEGQEEEENS